MLRRVFIWICLLSLVGCGGERERGVEVDLEQADPRGQKVTFWYQHTLKREEMLSALIAEFNRTNAHGIEVRGEYSGSYSDIYNKMLVGLQSGSLPSLTVAYNNQASVYYLNEGVVDLEPYMDSPRWGLSAEERADFFPAFLAQDNFRGAQVAFPPNRSMELLYYNADWLKELGYDGPPTSWEEFTEICRRAKGQGFSKAEDEKRHFGFLLGVDASRLASMTFSRGGDFMRGGLYTLNTPEIREGLLLMRALMQEGAVEMISEPGQETNDFGMGQVLFVTDSSTGIPYVVSAVESGLDFAWDVAPLPRSLEEPVVNVYGASVAVCRTTQEQQLAAWLFVKWFTEPEQQARWVEASGYFPVRKSTAGKLQSYFADHPLYAKAYGWLDYGKPEPGVTGYESVRRLIARAMVDVVLEGEDAEEVLSRLEQEANKVLGEY